MHPGGFEPPTARFVAEYSIQLSYGCIGKIYFTADIDIATKAISSKRWCIREDYSPCGSPFGAVAKATLSSLVPAVNSATSSIPSLLKISENMVHPGGFEPPTARFVAEYSIQLSYGCIGKFILLLILIPLLKPYQVRDGASGRIRTSDRSVRSRVLYPAELRMHRETYFTADFLIPLLKPYQVRDGASGRITRLAARPSGRC